MTRCCQSYVRRPRYSPKTLLIFRLRGEVLLRRKELRRARDALIASRRLDSTNQKTAELLREVDAQLGDLKAGVTPDVTTSTRVYPAQDEDTDTHDRALSKSTNPIARGAVRQPTPSGDLERAFGSVGQEITSTVHDNPPSDTIADRTAISPTLAPERALGPYDTDVGGQSDGRAKSSPHRPFPKSGISA